VGKNEQTIFYEDDEAVNDSLAIHETNCEERNEQDRPHTLLKERN